MKYILTNSDDLNKCRSPEDKIPSDESVIWDNNGKYIARCASKSGELVLAALNSYRGAVGL